MGGTALGVDTGIELEQLPALPTKHVMLLVSPHGLGTKEVFGAFDRLSPQGEMTFSPEEAAVALLNETLPIGKNAIWGPAVDLRPELAEYAGLVQGQQGFLTGSGPTLYFLSDTKEQAEDIAKRLSDLGHFTISTQTDQVGARLD